MLIAHFSGELNQVLEYIMAGFRQSIVGTSLGQPPSHGGLSTTQLGLLIANGAMAFGLNVVSFTANKQVGAVSMTVAGEFLVFSVHRTCLIEYLCSKCQASPHDSMRRRALQSHHYADKCAWDYSYFDWWCDLYRRGVEREATGWADARSAVVILHLHNSYCNTDIPTCTIELPPATALFHN